MTALLRIWARLVGWRTVTVMPDDDEVAPHIVEDAVLVWHSRGVLHVVGFWYGSEYDPRWRRRAYHYPLCNVAYWTKERD